MAKGDLSKQREVLIQQRHDARRLELFGNAGEAAQVREQHHHVGARIGRRQQCVAQLRVLEDLVSDPRGDVSTEGLPQELLAATDFRLELSRCCLSANRSRAYQGLYMGPQGLVPRHGSPRELFC